jgi:hypothetical protein
MFRGMKWSGGKLGQPCAVDPKALVGILNKYKSILRSNSTVTHIYHKRKKYPNNSECLILLSCF